VDRPARGPLSRAVGDQDWEGGLDAALAGLLRDLLAPWATTE
jgi:hypothetical protein